VRALIAKGQLTTPHFYVIRDMAVEMTHSSKTKSRALVTGDSIEQSRQKMVSTSSPIALSKAKGIRILYQDTTGSYSMTRLQKIQFEGTKCSFSIEAVRPHLCSYFLMYLLNFSSRSV